MGMSLSLPKLDGDRKLLLFEDLCDLVLRLQPRSYPALHHDNVVESNRYFVWVDGNARSPDRSYDPAPIGILPNNAVLTRFDVAMVSATVLPLRRAAPALNRDDLGDPSPSRQIIRANSVRAPSTVARSRDRVGIRSISRFCQAIR